MGVRVFSVGYASREKESLVADMVVGADGPDLDGPAPLRTRGHTQSTLAIAHFVARYPRTMLRDEARTVFPWPSTSSEGKTRALENHHPLPPGLQESFTFFHSRGRQTLAYLIPGPRGLHQPPAPASQTSVADSPSLGVLVTDAAGVHLRVTLPPGKMSPEVWEGAEVDGEGGIGAAVCRGGGEDGEAVRAGGYGCGASE